MFNYLISLKSWGIYVDEEEEEERKKVVKITNEEDLGNNLFYIEDR